MSESSKMGLLGSKSKTKELKKEAASKEDSPDRYAPYCIDSDSETYDTEALSIMDINDIIGVHSEPVGDSTLESEIAALSQIITESKTEPTMNIIDTVSYVQDKKQIKTVGSNVSSSLELSEPVDLNSVDTTSYSDKLQMSGEKSIGNSRLEVVGLNPNTNTHSSSSVSIGESCTKDVITEDIIKDTQISDKMSTASEVTNSNCKNNSDISSTTSALTSIGGISQSLQLIGEAYISEDSQESLSNDNETKDDMASNKVGNVEQKIEMTDSKDMCKIESSDIESTQETESATTAQVEIQKSESNPDVTNVAEVLEATQPVENSEETQSIKSICLYADKQDNINNATELLNPDLEITKDQDDSGKELVSEEQQAEETNLPDKESHRQETSLAENRHAVESNEDLTKENKSSIDNVNDVEATAIETEDLLNVKDEIATQKSSDTPIAESTVNKTEESDDIQKEGAAPEKSDLKDLIDSENTVDSISSPSPCPKESVISEAPEVLDVPEVTEVPEPSNDALTEAPAPSSDALTEVKEPESSQNEAKEYCDNESICTSMEKEQPQELQETLPKVPAIEEAESSMELNNKQSVLDVTKETEETETKHISNDNACDVTTRAEDPNIKIVPEIELSESVETPECTNMSVNEDNNSENVTAVPSTVPTESDDKIDEACKLSVSQLEFTTEDARDIVEDIADIETDSKVQTPETNADATATNLETFEKNTEEHEVKEGEALNECTDVSIVSSVTKDKSDEVPLTVASDDTQLVSVSPTHSTHSLIENECPASDTNDVKITESEKESGAQDTREPEKEKMINALLKESQDAEDVSDNKVTLEIEKDTKGETKDKTLSTEVCAPTESFAPEDVLPAKIEQVITTEENIKVESASKDNLQNDVLPEELKLDEIKEDKPEINEEKSITAKKQASDTMTNEEETIEGEEEAEEEAEEEMSLTFELDETELQDTEELDLQSTESALTTTESALEQIKDSTVGVEKEVDNVPADTKEKSCDTAKPAITEETSDKNLTKVPCSQEPEIPDKGIEDIAEKRDVEESLKPDVDDSNLKSILETTDNVVEMFAEEQCQNTQDIMTSILDNDVTDFKNILGTESSVENDIEDVLQHSSELPNLVEGEIEELAKKLPGVSSDVLNKDVEEAAQNIDSLEGLLELDLMPENVEPVVKEKTQESSSGQTENIEKEVDMSLLLDSNRESDMQQDTDYITDVISSCLTNDDGENLPDNEGKASTETKTNDKTTANESANILKIDDSIINETIAKDSEVMNIQKELTDSELQEADLDMDFEGNPLESVEDLEEERKLELSRDILLGSADQTESLHDPQSGVETSQPSSEISELESAVKFLQESEEQVIDSPLVLSPKMVESVVDDMSKQSDAGLFVRDEDICEDTSELVAELQGITSDSISISEAEIISEAAKLENERKLAEQAKSSPTVAEFPNSVEDLKVNAVKIESQAATSESTTTVSTAVEKNSVEISTELPTAVSVETPTEDHANDPTKLPAEVPVEKAVLQTSSQQDERLNLPKIPQVVSKVPESLPKTSILEERLKEPPKIEIPVAEVTKICSSPTTPKDSLLIQKDAKMSAYQKMLESPKLGEKGEGKITDTPRKDSEKHDFENVGSPRIILKIVKSAIAECGEPRSPKSPKIRSATNSPNPEDSPGQKLGKIKLKLSKSGHPSIISNENVEESVQWHTEGSSSLSPIGMKIKLSKSGDVSIVSSEKHEPSEDSKEIKRTESPIGMKIKLSKSGDALIVQQDANITKHKDKLDIMQSSPKRTESPIGMKIKLSRSGDASIIQPDKQEPQEEHKEMSGKSKEKMETTSELPKRTDSPIGMKIKLSKTGDASIIPSDASEETRETLKIKEKLESSPEVPKRTESPIGMKFKLAKTKGGASIIPVENTEECKERLEVPDVPKRTESPLGMKIKLSKSGDASIIHSEVQEDLKETKHKEKSESPQESIKQVDVGMKIKVTKVPDITSTVESTEQNEINPETIQRPESSLGMKIKLSKTGDASIIPPDKIEHEEEQKLKETYPDTPKRTESPIGVKIKLSKTGDASIIQSETAEDPNRMIRRTEAEYQKAPDSALGMKIKLVKTGDTSVADVDKKEKQSRRREIDSPLEMKIKLSKTGHPTIVACDNHGDSSHKSKEALEPHNFASRYKDPLLIKEPALKILKAGHSTIMQSNRSELTIEPVQMQSKKIDPSIEISPKRKEITISPIESKKSKLEAQLSQILPEVTIQPVMSRDQKQLLFDPKTSLISRQQMNVISQEISITQVRPSKPGVSEVSMSDKLKDILCKNVTNSPLGSDCEIIEHRPELIIVNENSNSSQDVVIIEEVPPIRMPEAKVPKKRGRPRRNPLPPQLIHQPTQILIPRDPLALDEIPPVAQFEQRENERPKRTCRNQKSYAPPKRGRGRGRGKRKLEASVDLHGGKRARVEQDLNAIEASTMAVITLDEHSTQQDTMKKSSELYKALKQPTMDRKSTISPSGKIDKQAVTIVRKNAPQKGDMPKVLEIGQKGVLSEPSTIIQLDPNKVAAGSQDHSCKTMVRPPAGVPLDAKNERDGKLLGDALPDREQKPLEKTPADDKVADKSGESGKQISVEGKDILTPPGHPNWLTPTSKRPTDNATRSETMSTVQVIDEETRMSAESGSRSQTPARNISAPATDQTIVNEESQGSVLSTATTESEKVKVKNRRMEINFDPDEGPFTVDKIAEYEWPLDRKGETFMIQEQISQYLGVKSFKRKYPDLKRRMVDMEERNYLRENGLVSEAMCDMGLTAVCSSEVLDVMCSDFPDQYEEYRKHMREKQVKEHSKKQKELTAAANAEKNRIDLAEMAVQSALSWNVSLNKARKENRKCSLDLQTFTIHVPKKQQKVETDRKLSHYPVALIPGQYTDYYREYTPAELRYYPLNTVLYGPMRPNERKFDSQSEGSQSDSDSDSSSDDTSSSSSEGTQDTEGSQSTMDDVDMEIATQKEEVKLKCKMCLKSLNKHSKNEVLIQCGTCGGNVHPSCIDLTLDMVPHIQSYAWQCTDCKTCAQCHDPADEDKMLFCDMCDRGYHIYCVGLRRVPQGRWHCQECAVCANCGSREPGGANSDRNSVAQWQHEYKKGDKNTRVYVSTLCVPCSKLWRKGRYCPHCSRCHTAQRPDLEASLVHCSACDKYLHLGCVETKGAVFDRKNYLCDFCTPNRQHHAVKPLISKTMKT